MGLSDGDAHPPADPGAPLALINWFKARATYMGGTPAHWGALNADSRKEPAWANVYADMDVIQPWNVGRYGTLAAVDKWKDDILVPDVKLAAANHQLYMPVVFPGFSWHNLKPGAKDNQIPRLGGEFLWRQAYNAKIAGATMLKIAMFDEVDEGTAIMKAAPHRNQAPDQSYWLTLDADGNELPSDWYLRVAGEITKMFHGEIPPTPALPGQRLAQATAPSDSELAVLIARVRQKALDYSRGLPDFICTQETYRDTTRTGRSPQWATSDKLIIQLSYFEQKENYRLLSINGKPTGKSLIEIGGTISFGDFGARLRNVFRSDANADFHWERWDTLDGRRVAVLSYSIDFAHTPFTATFGSIKNAKTIRWAAKGLISVDGETLDILRLTVESVGMPAGFGIKVAQSVTDYGNQIIGGRRYLLPTESVSLTDFADGRRARLDMHFTNYRKFAAESGITFDTPASQ